MSMMCKISRGCSATKGLCIHEKIMVAVVVVMVPVVGLALHWF